MAIKHQEELSDIVARDGAPMKVTAPHKIRALPNGNYAKQGIAYTLAALIGAGSMATGCATSHDKTPYDSGKPSVVAVDKTRDLYAMPIGQLNRSASRRIGDYFFIQSKNISAGEIQESKDAKGKPVYSIDVTVSASKYLGLGSEKYTATIKSKNKADLVKAKGLIEKKQGSPLYFGVDRYLDSSGYDWTIASVSGNRKNPSIDYANSVSTPNGRIQFPLVMAELVADIK